MTDAELKKLTRLELIEILIAQDQEIEELKDKLKRAEDQSAITAQLADRIVNNDRSFDNE